MILFRCLHNDRIIECGLSGGIVVESDTGKELGIDPDTIKYLSPSEPSKIICVGLNYYDHAVELEMEVPRTPIIFLKPPTSVIGCGEDIILPEDSGRIDHEAELAVVIGKTIKGVTEEEALDAVMGYTCMNDVTARDIQRSDGQWTRAKSFDTFAPLGPFIETESPDPGSGIIARVNGEVRQSSTLNNMIFKVPQLISFISGIMTLKKGDVISTGTPAGIGPIRNGDTVEIEIEGLGVLSNNVVSCGDGG